jgi:hypothetical protein
MRTEDEEGDTVYVPCVGVDNLNHLYEPHKDVTYCGVKIKDKKPNKKAKLSCWECTY